MPTTILENRVTKTEDRLDRIEQLILQQSINITKLQQETTQQSANITRSQQETAQQSANITKSQQETAELKIELVKSHERVEGILETKFIFQRHKSKNLQINIVPTFLLTNYLLRLPSYYG